MDLEIAEEISKINGTSIDGDASYPYTRHKLIEIAIVIIALCSIMADGVIIYLVARFNSLYTRTNLYVCCLCACNFVYMLFTPYALNLFSSADYVTARMVCFIEELFFLFMLANYLFVAVLMLDWYIVTYKSLSCSARCRNSYKFIIAVGWFFIIFFIISIILMCSLGTFWIPLLALMAIFSYVVLFCCIGSIHIMKIVNQRVTSILEIKSNLELSYATSYCLCWLPNFIAIVLSLWTTLHSGNDNLILLSFVIGYLHPIVLLTLMYIKDKKFKSYFNRTFRKKDRDNISEENVVMEDEHRTTLV